MPFFFTGLPKRTRECRPECPLFCSTSLFLKGSSPRPLLFDSSSLSVLSTYRRPSPLCSFPVKGNGQPLRTRETDFLTPPSQICFMVPPYPVFFHPGLAIFLFLKHKILGQRRRRTPLSPGDRALLAFFLCLGSGP